MNKRLLISIIIPCYNAEEYISQCLESILNQTYSNFEIICINDGATDSTGEILQKYSIKDKRINIINQPNSGLSSARNTGILNSTGEYIMFVDADDWLELNTINVLCTEERADLICFSYNRIFDIEIQPRNLNISGAFKASLIQRRIVGLLNEELHDPSQMDSLVTAWGKLFKAKVIKQHNIRFTDTALIGTEDALFNIEYLEYAETALVIDKPYYNYRKTNFSSLTQTYKPLLFEKWKVLFAKISLIIDGKDDDYNLALQNRICLSIIGLGLNETFNTKSHSEKIKKLKEILNDPVYVKAYSHLTLRYFPLHWKLFFFLAKMKNAQVLLIFLQVINVIINRKH